MEAASNVDWTASSVPAEPLPACWSRAARNSEGPSENSRSMSCPMPFFLPMPSSCRIDYGHGAVTGGSDSPNGRAPGRRLVQPLQPPRRPEVLEDRTGLGQDRPGLLDPALALKPLAVVGEGHRH